MKTDALSVCLLAPPKSHGGIGRYTDQLSGQIDQAIADVSHEPVFEELDAVGCVRAAWQASQHDVAHLQFEYGLFRPKLIYAWVFFPALFLFCRLRKTPIVVTMHEVWVPETIGLIQYLYVWLVHTLLTVTAEKLVFMTRSAESDFRPRRRTATTRIPHGVDTEAVKDIDSAQARNRFGFDANDIIVSQIGYVTPRKGTDTFLELADNHPDYEFLIAGGPLRTEDKPYVEHITKDISSNTHITGVLSDQSFHEAFIATDVAVLAYRDIRQSGILNWCFAYGVPVVCRVIDRFEELTEQGAPLILFSNENPAYPGIDEALSTALMSLDIRSRAMQSFGEGIDLSHVANQHTDLYQTMIEN